MKTQKKIIIALITVVVLAAVVSAIYFVSKASFVNGVQIKTSNQTKYDISFKKENTSKHKETLYAKTAGTVSVTVENESGEVSVILEKEKDGERYTSKERITKNSTFEADVEKGSVYITVQTKDFKGSVSIKLDTSAADKTDTDDGDAEEVSETGTETVSEDAENAVADENHADGNIETENDSTENADIEDESDETENDASETEKAKSASENVDSTGEALTDRVLYAGVSSEKFEFGVVEKALTYMEENETWFENLDEEQKDKKDSINKEITYDNLTANIERYGNQLIQITKAKVISIEEMKFDGKGFVTMLEVTDKKGDGDTYIVYIDQEMSDVVEGNIIKLYGIPLDIGVVKDDPNQGKIDAVAILGCYYKKNTGLF